MTLRTLRFPKKITISSAETDRVADEVEALLSMLSLNFYHAVFHLTSILILPLQKLSRANSHTRPNYSPYSEYTEDNLSGS